jgi:hypothetical protein
MKNGAVATKIAKKQQKSATGNSQKPIFVVKY